MRTLSALLLTLLLAGAASVGSEARPAACARSTVPLPPARAPQHLVDVAAISASAAWAVGNEVPAFPAPAQPLLLRWDGARWTRVAAVRAPNVLLNAVSASSPADAWAVGWNGRAGGTVVMRWNGRSWRVVPSPTEPYPTNRSLEDVVAIARDDAWAVGRAYDSNAVLYAPLLLHWDGRRWSQIRAPSITNLSLTSIDASSPTNVWAVGVARPRPGGPAIAVVLRLQKGVWRRVPLPHAPLAQSGLTDVSVISPTEVWAVGGSDAGPASDEQGEFRALALRWDGRRWRSAYTPALEASAALRTVFARSAGDAFALGGQHLFGWASDAWQELPFPALFRTAEGERSGLAALGAAPTGPLWAVGGSTDGAVPQPSIARYDCET